MFNATVVTFPCQNFAAASLIITFGGDAIGDELKASVGTAEITRLIGTSGRIRIGDNSVINVGTNAKGVSTITTSSKGVSKVSTSNAGVSKLPTNQGCITSDQG